jgi:ribonucleoside-diphosphate reductase beta chain
MSITEYRKAYKVKGSFEYPEYYERFQKAIASVWRPEEVSLSQDVSDWFLATEEEKAVIGGILKGFTQLELQVECYWRDMVTKIFPKHEIVSMCSVFSTFEGIHAAAYNILSDTLGIDEFEAFLGDPAARNKIDYFVNHTDTITSLGVFSGAAEGVSLFSSFAALLSFNLDGRFKGLSQIISWSALDEQQHSDAGCSLFRELDKEGRINQGHKDLIVEGFKAVLQNEDAFLEIIFEGQNLKSICKDDLYHYLRYRANDRLSLLNISYRFNYDSKKSDKIRVWFEPILRGQVSNDFFAHIKEGSMYVAKPYQDFSNIAYNSLDLSLS